jgi:hypothetical protein
MTHDLRRAHRIVWWFLPPLLALLLFAAMAVQRQSARALAAEAPKPRGDAR